MIIINQTANHYHTPKTSCLTLKKAHTHKKKKNYETEYLLGEVNLSTFPYQYEHWQKTDKFQLQEL